MNRTDVFQFIEHMSLVYRKMWDSPRAKEETPSGLLRSLPHRANRGVDMIVLVSFPLKLLASVTATEIMSED
jgi:hypothetical protein